MNQPVTEGAVEGGLADVTVNTVTATPASPPYNASPATAQCSSATNNHAASPDHCAVLDLTSAAAPQPSLSSLPSPPHRDLSSSTFSVKEQNTNNFTNISTLSSKKSHDKLLNLSSSSQLTSLHEPHPNGIAANDEIPQPLALDIGAGLTTIDTSSLTTIDSSQIASSFEPVPIASVKCHKVTAHATIIPPLASSIQDGPSTSSWPAQEEASPPSSPAPPPPGTPFSRSASVHSRPSSQLSHHSSSPQSFSATTTELLVNLTNSKNKSSSPSCGEDPTKSPAASPSCIQSNNRNTSVKSLFSTHDKKIQYRKGDCKVSSGNCDIKSYEFDHATAKHHDCASPNPRDLSSSKMFDTTYTSSKSPFNNSCDSSSKLSPPGPSLPLSRSSCPQSPSSSPVPPSPCSSDSALVSGAGCEVRGMPANPVSVAATKVATPRLTATTAMDTCDGGRLTFFKEGKLVLELSHNSGSVAGSDSDCCWVQVKSKTYWPPPSLYTSTAAPLQYSTTPAVNNLHGGGRTAGTNWRRKRSDPRPWRSPPSNGVTSELRQGCSPEARTSLLITPPAVRLYRRRTLNAGGKMKRNPFYRNHPYSGIPLCSTRAKTESKCWWPSRRSLKQEPRGALSESEWRRRSLVVEKKAALLLERSVAKADLNTRLSQVSCDRFLLKSPSPNRVVSPRKRFLKQMEVDHESGHSKKKILANYNNPGRSSNSSDSSKNNQARNMSNARHMMNAAVTSGSAHSIDAILSSEKKNESYLKSLLKPEHKPSSNRHSHREPRHDRHDTIKQESPSEVLSYVKRERGGDSHARTWSSSQDRREVDDRRERDHPSYSSSHHGYNRRSSPSRSSPHHLRSSPPRSSPHSQHLHHSGNHPNTGVAPSKDAHAETGFPAQYPAAALPPHNLAGLYPQLYDPNYLLLNGLNPLTAGGIMSNPHGQMAVAAAAAAAAAASISSHMSSYGLGPIQFSALAATQYSNLISSALNPVAFNPAAMAAAATAPALNPNLPTALTPALTPGAATLPMPPLNPSALPPTLTPGLSPGLPPTSHYQTMTSSNTNCSTANTLYSSSRTSPYATHSSRSPYPPHCKSPYPLSRSPYSPHTKSYPQAKSPQQRAKSPVGSFSCHPQYGSRSNQPCPQQYHHPTQPHPSRQTSPWKPAAPTHQLSPPKPQDQVAEQDLPLNLTKPRTK